MLQTWEDMTMVRRENGRGTLQGSPRRYYTSLGGLWLLIALAWLMTLWGLAMIAKGWL